MIRAVAFCPHPPVMIPAVARGASPELDPLRAACQDALRRCLAGGPDGPEQLLVLGAADATAEFGPGSRGGFAGFGVDLTVALPDGPANATARRLPLSLAVAAWLLESAGVPVPPVRAFGVGPDWDGSAAAVAAATACGERSTAVLVMADGSARRSVKAPGHLDPRAEPYDAALVAALGSGRHGALADLDPALGDELLAAGARVWPALAVLLREGDGHGSGAMDAQVLFDAAPYGVEYAVACWLPTAAVTGPAS